MAQEFNSTLKGLNLDVNELQNEGVLYSFALNATIENYSEPQPEPYRSNMASNVFCYNPEPNEKIVGHTFIKELDKVLLFTYNKVTKTSFIIDLKVLKKDPYTTDLINCKGATETSYVITTPQCKSTKLVETKCFNWSESPKTVYKVTDCTVNFYFVNGIDDDRVLNFDYDENYNLKVNNEFLISNNDDCNPIYNDQIDCGKTKWNPNLDYPCITLDAVSGNKVKGSYSYFVAYSTYSGIPLTSFKALTQPLHVNKNGGGIKINIENISVNSKYRFLTIIAAETINGITTYHKKAVISVNQKQYIDFDNGGENISLNTLLSTYPFYKSSNFLTESNNILFRAGVSEYEKFNLQPIINQIELNWTSVVATEGDYAKSEFANKYKSFLRDENYMLAITILLDNLEEGPTFPFVGRVATASDRQTINTIEYECDTILTQKWQTTNTASLTYTNNTPLSVLAKDCDCKQVYQSGTFGYMESTEVYPNNPEVWGDLCGKPIKMFKFPDIKISPHQSDNSVHSNSNYIFPLGIKVVSDVSKLFDDAVTQGLITQEQRDRIKGYKILRSDRIGNESIIAKGLLYDVWSYNRSNEKDLNFSNTCTTDKQKYYYANYPYNDLNPDVFLSSQETHYDGINRPAVLLSYDNNKTKFTFHSPETHFYKPQLGGLIKYEAELHGTAEGFFNTSKDFAEYRLLSEKHHDLAKAYAAYISRTTQDPTEQAIIGLATSAGKAGGSYLGKQIDAGSKVASASSGIPSFGGSAGDTLGAVGGLVGSLIGTNITKNLLGLSIFKTSAYFNAYDKMLSLLKAMCEPQQYHYQHQSVGKYNQILTNLPREDRLILEKEYIEEGKQTVKDANTTLLFNNYNRESSVYFKVKDNRPDYAIKDNSRVKISDNNSSFTGTVTNGEIEDLVSYRVTWTVGTYKFITIKCDGTEEITNGVNDGISFSLFGLNIGINNIFNIKPKVRTFACVRDLRIERTNTIALRESDLELEVLDTVNCERCIDQMKATINYPCKCNNPTSRTISSFYVSNKVYRPNQYGSIYDVRWISLDSCGVDFSNNQSCNNIFFGGDTYITRMSLKRKQDFFIRNTYKLNTDTDFNYSLVPNLASPIYFFDTIRYNKFNIFNTQTALSFPVNSSGFNIKPITKALQNLFQVGLFSKSNLKPANYKLDCYNNVNDLNSAEKNKFQNAALQGVMYSYIYGIPYFITESSINLDLRDSKENPWDKFYPEESNLSNWLQETNTPIKQDNTYYYDQSFSKQPTELFTYIYDTNFKGLEDCKTKHPQRVIYSAQSLNIDDSNYQDNYLLNKALDYYDFTKEAGRLTSIDSIESNRVLVRFENTTHVYNSDIRLNTDTNTVLLSTGNIFNNPPQEYSKADGGYFGSQHRIIQNTSEGHFIIDAKRGHIFILGNGGQGLLEISNQGLRHWFKENLPFKIQETFSNINVDDNYNGIGIAMSYDKLFNQVFISKLDYEPKSNDIAYDIINKRFYLKSTNTTIELNNKKYFKNKSWTISYSLYRKEWVSFHSWAANYYVDLIDTFLAGNNTGLFQHNITNKSYQIFFNKLEPFIIETITKGRLNYDILKAVQYYADFIRYHNEYDFYYNLEQRFNKAIVYGKSMNSGLLQLDKQSDNYKNRLEYPIVRPDYTQIEEVMKEQAHCFNQFRNRIKNDYTYLPMWINDSNNVNKNINLQALTFTNIKNNDYIRDSNIKVRLIQDKLSRYKIIFKGTILDLEPSTR